MESFCLLSPSQTQVLNTLMLLGSWVCVRVAMCQTFHNADTWWELKTGSFTIAGLKHTTAVRAGFTHFALLFLHAASCPWETSTEEAQASPSMAETVNSHLKNNFERQSCPTAPTGVNTSSPQAPPDQRWQRLPWWQTSPQHCSLGQKLMSVSDRMCHLRVTKLVAKRTLTYKAATTLSPSVHTHSLWTFQSCNIILVLSLHNANDNYTLV